jgi:hypothetical protein
MPEESEADLHLREGEIMLVKTYRDGRQCTGLHIGEANARRYFSKRAPSIEIKLDDLSIQCTLDTSFWEGRPEIHDIRLSEWLEFKTARRRAGREAVYFSLVPSGPGAFVLRPDAKDRYDSFGADVSRARKEHPEPISPHRHMPPVDQLSVA